MNCFSDITYVYSFAFTAFIQFFVGINEKLKTYYERELNCISISMKISKHPKIELRCVALGATKYDLRILQQVLHYVQLNKQKKP